MIKLSFDESSSPQQKDFKKLCKKELLISFFRFKKEEQFCAEIGK